MKAREWLEEEYRIETNGCVYLSEMVKREQFSSFSLFFLSHHAQALGGWFCLMTDLFLDLFLLLEYHHGSIAEDLMRGAWMEMMRTFVAK